MNDRTPVVLLDTIGYAFYADEQGRPYLPAERYDVRLVTDIRKVGEATGPELSAVLGVDKHDEAAQGEAVRFLARFGGIPADRLITVTERMLLPAARLRAQLGLPGATEDEMVLFRDKVRMKEHLSAHGVRVPQFAPFDVSTAQALLAAHPAVVAKPRRGTGAMDVHVLRSAAEAAAFADEHAARLADFEVEEFIDGDLFHVDSVVRDGKVLVATASRYLDETTSYLRLAPSRSVSVEPGRLLDRLLAFNQQVIDCYPAYSGVTHHEMFVSGDDIVFCEIAARAGGGGVIAGFRSRTGVDLDEAALRAQVGEPPPDYRTPAPHLIGFVVIYSAPAVVRRPLRVPDEPWVLEAQILARPGDTIRAPVNCNDAVAIVSVRGDSTAEVVARMQAVVLEVQTSLTHGGELDG
jgi:biotin carboxylase